jgi:hypothetical protein
LKRWAGVLLGPGPVELLYEKIKLP